MGSTLTYYTVKYSIEGDHTVRQAICMTEEDYSAPIDFPTMLAIKHFNHARFASRIHIIEYRESK